MQKRYTIQATNREEQVATDSMEWGAFPGVSGERLNGIQEVRGSIPLISTRDRVAADEVATLFFIRLIIVGETAFTLGFFLYHEGAYGYS